jgi:quercetin dioxygenase-like cupin family protein/predicted enzyme related to lactoylglutathione lyase
VRVQGVVWAGTKTDRFHETVAFFRDVLGVPLVEEGPDFAWAKLPDSSQFEVFGPGMPDHDEFTTGPVPEFLVDDLDAAAAELRDRQCEVLGGLQGTPDEGWLHFRAPDGNVYGLTNGHTYWRPRLDEAAPTTGVRRFEGADHGSSVSFFAGQFEPGTGPRLHTHPHDETFLIEAGTATFTIAGASRDARAGDVLVVPAETPHAFVAGPGAVRLVSIQPVARMLQRWVAEEPA